MKKLVRYLTIAIVSLFSLVGCGDDDNSSMLQSSYNSGKMSGNESTSQYVLSSNKKEDEESTEEQKRIISLASYNANDYFITTITNETKSYDTTYAFKYKVTVETVPGLTTYENVSLTIQCSFSYSYVYNGYKKTQNINDSTTMTVYKGHDSAYKNTSTIFMCKVNELTNCSCKAKITFANGRLIQK